MILSGIPGIVNASREWLGGWMEVFEPSGTRMEAALELFASGESFTFSGVDFRLLGLDVLECSVETSWLLGNVTEATAREDIASVRRTFDYLSKESPRFPKLTCGRTSSTVVFSGYGMGSVEVCSEFEGAIKWAAGFPKPGPG